MQPRLNSQTDCSSPHFLKTSRTEATSCLFVPACNSHLILWRGKTLSSLLQRCPDQDPHLLAHLDPRGPPPYLRPSPFGSSRPWESSTIDCRKGCPLILQWKRDVKGRLDLHCHHNQTSPTWELNSPSHRTPPRLSC